MRVNNRRIIRFLLFTIIVVSDSMASHPFTCHYIFVLSWKDSQFHDLRQVVVQQINFVERSASPVALYDKDFSNMATGNEFSTTFFHYILCN